MLFGLGDVLVVVEWAPVLEMLRRGWYGKLFETGGMQWDKKTLGGREGKGEHVVRFVWEKTALGVDV